MHSIVPRQQAAGTPPERDRTDTEPLTYTAAELLEIVLEAYRRGWDACLTRGQRDHWNNPEVIETFRGARRRTEVADMRLRAHRLHERYGYPAGYDYRGGPVDWDTGMPEGSGCAWLRRKRNHGQAAA